MSILDAVVRNAAQANREEPGDYRGEDGLLYCGKCNTPKEWADQDGKVFPCSCRCSEEAAKREKEKTHRGERFSRACSLPIFKELHDPMQRETDLTSTTVQTPGHYILRKPMSNSGTRSWSMAEGFCSGGILGPEKPFFLDA